MLTTKFINVKNKQTSIDPLAGMRWLEQQSFSTTISARSCQLSRCQCHCGMNFFTIKQGGNTKYLFQRPYSDADAVSEEIGQQL